MYRDEMIPEAVARTPKSQINKKKVKKFATLRHWGSEI
jgi:hypothetical protein